MGRDGSPVALLLFVDLGAPEQARRRRQRGGHTGRPLDDRGEVVVDEGAVALERRGAERAQDGRGILRRHDRLGVVELRRRTPEVVLASAAARAPPAAATTRLALALALLLPLLLCHCLDVLLGE